MTLKVDYVSLNTIFYFKILSGMSRIAWISIWIFSKMHLFVLSLDQQGLKSVSSVHIKPLHVIHHYVSPVGFIFQAVFLFFLPRASSVKKYCLCYSQTHTYLMALLFSSCLSLCSVLTPKGNLAMSDIVLCPADQNSLPLITLPKHAF